MWEGYKFADGIQDILAHTPGGKRIFLAIYSQISVMSRAASGWSLKP
jgi:hypothetical protein